MIEEGNLWSCLVLLAVTSMSSVLLSLSLCMLAVAQTSISLIHECMEGSNSYVLSGGADTSNYKSSANEWCVVRCKLLIVDKGLMHMEKCRAKN